MKTTTSPNGHFGIHFFFAIAIAVAALTGCSAAAGEPSAESTAELDDKATEPQKETITIDTANAVEHLEGQTGQTPGATPSGSTPPSGVHRIQ